MKRIKFEYYTSMLILSIVFYTIGILCMNRQEVDYLKHIGIAEQNEYTYTTSDGEEHEGETLIDIQGLGPILTYRDVYLSSPALFVFAIVIGCFSTGQQPTKTDSDRQLDFVVFMNCILAYFLIRLTTHENLYSTIFFCVGILAASTRNYGKKSKN